MFWIPVPLKLNGAHSCLLVAENTSEEYIFNVLINE